MDQEQNPLPGTVPGEDLIGHASVTEACWEVMERMHELEASVLRDGTVSVLDLAATVARCDKLLHWSLVRMVTVHGALEERPAMDVALRLAYDLNVTLADLGQTAGLLLIPAERVRFTVRRVLEVLDVGARTWVKRPPPGPPVFARRRRLERERRR